MGLMLDRRREQCDEPIVVTCASRVSRGWMARLSLPRDDEYEPEYDVVRQWLDPYQQRLSTSSGFGERHFRLHQRGVYEADSTWRSMRSQRIYMRWNGVTITDVSESRQDAIAWLREMPSAQPSESRHARRVAQLPLDWRSDGF